MQRFALPALVFLLACPTWAACPEDPDAMNRKGREFAAKERWADAEKTFAALADCRPAPTAFLSLAITQMELGKLVAARKSAEKARSLALAVKQPLAAFDDKLKEIDAALPRVVLRLQSGLRDVHPRVDGVEVGLVNGTEILVDPGEHKLVVRVEGKPPFETKIVVAKGSVIDVRVDFGEDGPKTAPTGTASGAAAPGSGPGGGTSPNLGPVVLAGAGAVLGVVAYLKYRERNDFYLHAPMPQNSKSEIDDANRARYLWGGLAGVGAAMVVGGAVWWAAAPSKQNVAVLPAPAGVAMVGRF